MKYQKELDFAKELAEEAGEIMRRYFQADDIGTELKEDDTPITVADTKINQLVIDRVKEVFPHCGVIGEEDSYENDSNEQWIVDPIDGTKPYSVGIPVSTFCLAYVVDGEVKVAVVNDPFQKRLYHAAAGGGAFVNDQKINVSSVATLTQQNMFMGGSKRLTQLGTDLRRDKSMQRYEIYSYAYAAMQIASGNFVCAAMEYGSPWDPAAASLIVQEAGGKATDLLGNPRDYTQWGQGTLMTNGHVHDELLRLIDYENYRD